MSDRTIQDLVKSWDALTNDDQMVAFIDGLTPGETHRLDRAISQGRVSKQPLYITQEAAE
jgi:hypothetical protein